MPEYIFYDFMLQYKGFYGTIEYSHFDNIYHGFLINTCDIVTYESTNITDLEKEFILSIEDYLELLNELSS